MTADNQFAILIEEYKSLREEIKFRVESQQQIIKYSLTLLSISAGIIAFFSQEVTNPRIAYLIISLIFSSFTFMFLDHDMMVATIGLYIDKKLRPRMEELISGDSKRDTNILEWEKFRGEIHHKNFINLPFIAITSASRYGILIIPSVISIVLYYIEKQKVSPVPKYEGTLFYAAIVVLLLIILASIINSRLYLHSGEVKKPKIPKRK